MAKKPGLYRAKNGAYYRIGKNGRARFCAAPKGKKKRKGGSARVGGGLERDARRWTKNAQQYLDRSSLYEIAREAQRVGKYVFS